MPTQDYNSENNTPVQHLSLVARMLTHSLKITPLHGDWAVHCLYQGIDHGASYCRPGNAMPLILLVEDLTVQDRCQLQSYISRGPVLPAGSRCPAMESALRIGHLGSTQVGRAGVRAQVGKDVVDLLCSLMLSLPICAFLLKH